MKKIAAILKGVSKTYGEGESTVHALKNVDLEIYESELLMIVGPSGSGKTTLISVIGGTLNYEAGEIDLFGTNIGALDNDALTEFRRDHIGFIFQQLHLLPSLTCAENVAIPLIIKGVKFEKAVEKAKEVLTFVHLPDKANRFPRDLSGGEQQRVAIARALVHEPQLLVCDEPTSNLDAATGTTIVEFLKTLVKDSRRSIIVVTHDHRIMKYADRVAEMDDGKIREIHHWEAAQKLTQ
jgi:putative ABC transport system ATP-binding protein